ncbi:hypothetical protein Tco_0844247 [Tanacetum coccineum]
MNMGQDRQIQTVGGNGGNQFGYQTKEKGCCVSSDSFVDCSKKEAGIQLQAKEFDLMAAAGDLDEIEEVIANCILMANLQQASTSGTQSDKAPIYDSDGSAEVQHHDNCYNNDIFNMFTQEDQYTKLLEPISKPHLVQQNDNNVTFVNSSVEQNRGTVEQHSATNEETCAYHESLLNNLVVEVDKVNTVNRKMRETNAELTTELARYKIKKNVLKSVRKKRFENCISKKENEYAKLWNDWFQKCEECKYDKISYDKAYHDMQRQIERLQARLGDLKGKSNNTPCASGTLNPLSQKLDDKNIKLEYHVLNYAKENAYLKTTYKKLFDFIQVSRAQTKSLTDSLNTKHHDTIYENAKLRSQLFDKTPEQKYTTKGTSVNAKFENQSIEGKPVLYHSRNHSIVRQSNAFQSE